MLGPLLALAIAAPPAQAEAPWVQEDPRFGLLTPIPDRGAVPPIVDLMHAPDPGELDARRRVRALERRIRLIAHEHFGPIRVPEVRARGIARLRELTDPLAFGPMVEALAGEGDDVRLAMLDHFADNGAAGQAALARVAVLDADRGIADEALRRLEAPASEPVLAVLDETLRSPTHKVANRAGLVAGTLNALETIPLLIFAQAASDPVERTGDLAWIAIGTQRAYVARIDAIVGNGVAAFRPIPGVIQEGVILRVVDAVAVIYRTEIHWALVNMTTRDWGRSTGDLGYDIEQWWSWYNTEYLPFKNEQIRRAAMERSG